jgi:23S rRNA (pseudouridine1915-N3)-methyltransferase
MKITVLFTGKTAEHYLEEGIAMYEKRIRRYLPFEIRVIPAIKGVKEKEQIRRREGEQILRAVGEEAYLILLDERGRGMRSVEFAGMLQKRMNGGTRHLVLLVGGAYGVSREVFDRADLVLQLSAMTFSHQVVRILLMEQLYRALTIIHGEPYHHA